MLKSLSLTLVALSSYVLSLPVVCNNLMTNEIRVAQAVEGEANVLDELLEVPEFREAYLNGDYDADPGVDDFDVLYAVESGYSTSSKYSLYLYVWNKSGNGSDVYNFSNRYNAAEFYSFATYKSFSMDMQFVNRSDDYRFIKYRISNVSENNFLNSESGRREYGIKGIEIAKIDGSLQKFKEYPVAKKWNYEGNKDDLFISYNSSFEYLQLDLGSGAFGFNKRDEVHEYPGWTEVVQDNLYYVYFDIPKTYQNSGSLYSIHADYYDFDFSNKIAFLLDENTQNYYYEHYNEIVNLLSSGYDIGDSELSSFKDDYIFHAIFDKYPGARNKAYSFKDDPDDNFLNRFSYQIYIAGLYDSGNPLQGSQTIGQWYQQLTSEQFINQFKYLIPINNINDDVNGHYIGSFFDRLTAEQVTGQLSSDVYKNIHMCNISRDDSNAIATNWDLISECNKHNWFYNLFHTYYDDYDIQDINCIEHVDSNDSNLSDLEFKNKYYVAEGDSSSIKERISSDSDTYIFRFKIDESSSTSLSYAFGVDNCWHPSKAIGFVAPRYHGVVDFDVIDMTFINEDDKLETIPVVSDPVNVFPDVPSPYTNYTTPGCGGVWSSLLWILMLVLMILAVILFLKWFIPWKRNAQMIHAVKSSGKTASKNKSNNHYTYNIKKTYINKSPRKKRKKRRK